MRLLAVSWPSRVLSVSGGRSCAPLLMPAPVGRRRGTASQPAGTHERRAQGGGWRWRAAPAGGDSRAARGSGSAARDAGRSRVSTQRPSPRRCSALHAWGRDSPLLRARTGRPKNSPCVGRRRPLTLELGALGQETHSRRLLCCFHQPIPTARPPPSPPCPSVLDAEHCSACCQHPVQALPPLKSPLFPCARPRARRRLCETLLNSAVSAAPRQSQRRRRTCSYCIPPFCAPRPAHRRLR